MPMPPSPRVTSFAPPFLVSDLGRPIVFHERPLADTPWGTRDFHVADADRYIVCFGGRTT